MSELWARRLSGDRSPFRYLPGVTNAALSPDERWVAYVADEVGKNEIRSVGDTYDVTPDGQRFLFSIASRGLESTAPTTVVLNCPADLKKN